MKRSILFLMILCLTLAAVAGCGEGNESSHTASTFSLNTESETQSEEEKADKREATGVPGVYRFLSAYEDDGSLAVNEAGGVLLVQHVQAGMDSFSAELEMVELFSGETLGTLSLPDGMWKLGRTADGGFYVLAQQNGEVTLYGKDCKKAGSFLLQTDGIAYDILFTEDLKTAVFSDIRTGNLLRYDVETQTSETIYKAESSITLLGRAESSFWFLGEKQALYRADDNGSVVKVESDFTGYYLPPYLVIATKKGYNVSELGKGVFTFYPSDVSDEYPVCAFGGLLVGTKDKGLRLYDLENRKAANLLTDLQCTSYTFFMEDGLLITLANENGKLQFYVIDPAEVVFTESLDAKESGEGDFEDPIVSDWVGSEEAIARVKRIKETYGVIVGYESEDFEDELFWYTVEHTDRENAEVYLRYVEEYLAMLPAGIMKEIRPGKEPVIFLCKEIAGDVAGFAGDYTRHPFIAVEAASGKDCFSEILAHEVFHLLFEQNPEMLKALEKWDAMNPEGAFLMSYEEKNAVEMTPGGDGQFEDVWFINGYARTFPAEDRAVVGQYLFLSESENKLSGYFRNYPHLKEKAELFCTLLHEGYEACRNETPYWEKITNYTYKGAKQ